MGINDFVDVVKSCIQCSSNGIARFQSQKHPTMYFDNTIGITILLTQRLLFIGESPAFELEVPHLLCHMTRWYNVACDTMAVDVQCNFLQKSTLSSSFNLTCWTFFRSCKTNKQSFRSGWWAEVLGWRHSLFCTEQCACPPETHQCTSDFWGTGRHSQSRSYTQGTTCNCNNRHTCFGKELPFQKNNLLKTSIICNFNFESHRSFVQNSQNDIQWFDIIVVLHYAIINSWLDSLLKIL